MSDHEGGEFDDWEESPLPVGPTYSFEPQEHLTHGILPNQNLQALDQSSDHKANPIKLSTGPAGLDRPPRKVYRPLIQGIPRGPQRNSGGQDRRLPTAHKILTVQNAASESRRQGAPPDAFFEFSVTWGTLLRNIPDDRTTSVQVSRRRLNDICTISETFIATPDCQTNRIAIWGNEEQVAQAKTLLGFFEKDIRANGVRPSRELWTKISAHDARADTRGVSQARLKNMEDALHTFGQDLEYDFEAYLLLPEDLNIDTFKRKYDRQALAELRRQSHCRIDFHNSTMKCIKVCAQEEHTLLAVYQRVRNIVAESMCCNQIVKLNWVHLPSSSKYRNRVRLEQDPKTSLHLPTLHGEPLPSAEIEEWDDLCQRMQKRYRKDTRRALDECLKGMKATQKYVIMRVSFGGLGFLVCQLPPPDQDGHLIDEFADMVVDTRTVLECYHLRSAHGNLCDLFDNLVESGAFHNPLTIYTVYFDHLSREKTTLRLETVFKPGFDGSELDMVEKRWLKFADSEQTELLEINLFDFECLGIQFKISAMDLYEHQNSTKPRTSFFESNIGFKAPAQGIKAPPRRRAFFPPGVRDLVEVSEITVVRFQFRDTEGIFELRRRDVYNESPYQKSAMPTKSGWSATYFYPEWENLLREFGSLKPGQDVGWQRSVTSLFPEDTSEDHGALPKGFKAFMEECQEIQYLLTKAMESLSSAERR